MLNRITIQGRLTRDPELRRTQSGTEVASFTLAVDRDFTNDNGERATDFVDCVSWRSAATFISKYFKKGNMAIVSGRLQIRTWVDNDGNNRRSAEIVTDNIYFGESKKSNGTPNTGAYDPVDIDADEYEELADDSGDLPF